MHPKDKPNPDFISAPPPVRSGTIKPTVKQVSTPLVSSPQSDDDSSSDAFMDAKQDFDEDDSSDDESLALGYKPETKMVIVHSDDKSCTADSQGLYHY